MDDHSEETYEDFDARIDAAVSARHDALIASLKAEAATAFNGWLAAHATDYPDERPHTADEIEAVNAADKFSKRPEWYAGSTREHINDLGHGVEESSDVRALLRLIVWATEDRPPSETSTGRAP